MMRERFIAFLMRQPTDMFLADDVGYLTKMRSDEKPVFLIKRDERLEVMFPGNQVQLISEDYLSVAAMPVGY